VVPPSGEGGEACGRWWLAGVSHANGWPAVCLGASESSHLIYNIDSPCPRINRGRRGCVAVRSVPLDPSIAAARHGRLVRPEQKGLATACAITNVDRDGPAPERKSNHTKKKRTMRAGEWLAHLVVLASWTRSAAPDKDGFRQLDEQRNFKNVYSSSGALGNLHTSSPFSSTTEMPTLVTSDLCNFYRTKPDFFVQIRDFQRNWATTSRV